MAVTPIPSKYCCVTIQQQLDSITGANTPDKINIKNDGFLSAVLSGENTNGFSAVQTESRQGKALPGIGNRTVEIKYRKRICPTVTQVASNLCDSQSASTDDWLYSGVSVDCIQDVGFSLNEEEFRQLCESPDDRMGRYMQDYIAALKSAVNADLIAKYIAGLGDYFSEPPPAVPVDSAVAPKTLFPFNASGQTNAQFLNPLMIEWMKSAWKTMPILVNGSLVEQFKANMPIFADDNDGKDAARARFRPPMFLDFEVDRVFADGFEHMLAWVPGFVQMTNWYRFEEGTVYEKIDENYQQVKMSDDGFTFDFQADYDRCTNTWNFALTKQYDLFKLPPEALSSDCGQFSNGCLQYLVDCGDIDCNYLKL